MNDRKKVLNDLQELCEHLFHEYKVCYKGDEKDTYDRFLAANNALNLLQEEQKFFVDSDGKITPLPIQPQWEKASKELPTDRDWYLGIFQEADTGWINPIPFICDYVGKLTPATTKEGWIIRHCTDREVDDSGGYYYNLKCVAWMPLPEPPEEEKQ